MLQIKSLKYQKKIPNFCKLINVVYSFNLLINNVHNNHNANNNEQIFIMK